MSSSCISVVGLGYVGLPVAVEMSKKYSVFGFDVNSERIEELKNGFDRTKEVQPEVLSEAQIVFTNQIEDLQKANFHIVAVPTPVDEANTPDLSILQSATQTVGKALKKGDIVVFESTVFPGATEEICIPILEKVSGLTSAKDFFVGYSPERINPGDKEHTFTKITKVVAAQTQESLEKVAEIYSSVVTAGVFKAQNIKVAEAAKCIENTQRDINIALMNELAVIFERMKIDTLSVLEAASTKWNFLPFKPGLVGGHCIGVDPYYLTYKAEKLGYRPDIILAGRRINDSMGSFIATQVVKELHKQNKVTKDLVITVLGLTFKENCPDLRNTKVLDIIEELRDYGVNVQVNDPEARHDEALGHYQIELQDIDSLKPADAVILAVSHDVYKDSMGEKLAVIAKPGAVVYDIKGVLDSASIASEYHLIRL